MKSAVLFLLFITVNTSAQDFSKEKLDSLFEKFVYLKTGKTERADKKITLQNEISGMKCAFGLVSQVRINFDRFTIEQQNILKPLLFRPAKEDSMLSPSGFFWVHFDRTTFQTPAYDNSLTVDENVWQVCLALDSALSFEVNTAGFSPPPSDNGEGGDNRYDVYITSAGGSYGFTQPDIYLGDQKYSSHIEIHYDYRNFFTRGLNAMRVTVAHELNHAMQVGNYTGQKIGTDLALYEITSTSMEEFVFDEVNDYYAYLDNYFSDPGKRLTRSEQSLDGYDLAIWNLYLVQKFNFDIITRQWELFVDNTALTAIDESIKENNSLFGTALNEFGVWTFFTGYRNIPGEYFDEGGEYPLIQSNELNYQSGELPVVVNAEAASNNFITFISTQRPGDTLVALVSHTKTENTNSSQFEYILSDNPSNGTKIIDNYFADFNVSEPENWKISELFYNPEIHNYQVVREFNGTPRGFYAFPNPFFYNKYYRNDCNCVEFKVDAKDKTEADLNIYTSAMELMYSAILPIENSLIGTVVRWQEVRSRGLGSGVYIYVTKIGEEITTGKLVIFNE